MPKDPASTDSPDARAPDERTIDTRLVKRLAAILRETGMTEIEVERGGQRIRVAAQATVAATAAVPAAAPASAAPGEAPAATVEHNGDAVPSPMVGTVYLQPQPGGEPFVRVGAQVDEGQTLLIVEAMKTMNPIPAPRAGKVTAILVSDAQPVEFGEPLIVLE